MLDVLLCVLHHNEHVGIELAIFKVFWLQRLIGQHILEDVLIGEELELASIDHLEQRHHADLSLVGHSNQLNKDYNLGACIN